MARNLEDTGKHLIRILRQGGKAAAGLTELWFEDRDRIIDKVNRFMKSGRRTQAQIEAFIHREISDLKNRSGAFLEREGQLAGEFQATSSASYLEVLGVSDPKVYNVTKKFIRESFRKPFPFQNVSVDDLLTGSMANLDQHLVNITRQARLQGQTVASTSRFIEEASGAIGDPALRRKANALARTAIAQVANDVRFQSFDNEEQVRGVLYVATLDHRTSNVCKSLDGTFYSRRSQARVPPLHVSCRSTLVPVLKGETLDDVKDQLQRPAVEVKSVKELEEKGLRTSGGRVRKPSRSDSSPLRGTVKREYVTYEQWLKSQPVAYQKAILGPKAYDKFKSSNLRTALGVIE